MRYLSFKFAFKTLLKIRKIYEKRLLTASSHSARLKITCNWHILYSNSTPTTHFKLMSCYSVEKNQVSVFYLKGVIFITFLEFVTNF